MSNNTCLINNEHNISYVPGVSDVIGGFFLIIYGVKL
jgi:hypothetical protein